MRFAGGDDVDGGEVSLSIVTVLYHSLCCITLSPHCLTELVTPLWPSQAWRAAGQNTPVSSQLSPPPTTRSHVQLEATIYYKLQHLMDFQTFSPGRTGVVSLGGGDDLGLFGCRMSAWVV